MLLSHSRYSSHQLSLAWRYGILVMLTLPLFTRQSAAASVGQNALGISAATHGDIRVEVVEQHADRLRLAYSVGSAIDRWTGAATEAGSVPPGLLRLLTETAVVGIPIAADVEMDIVESSLAGTFAAPEIGGEEWDLPLEGPVFLGQTGFLRDQRVVQLNFAPKLVNGGNQVQLFNRVVVDLYFSPSQRTADHGRRSRWEEQLYEQSILNYEQAAAWRQSASAAHPLVQEPASNDYIRMTVRRRGMHRVTGQDLEDAGVALAEVTPSAIRMRYGTGLTLGRSTTVHAGAVLHEIPVVVEDGGDGKFDAADALLFYGEPVERWAYADGVGYFWRQNLYTKDNVYFLEWDDSQAGTRAEELSGALRESEAIRSDRYRERLHAEDEQEIFTQLEGIKSGYDWFWESFRGNARNFSEFFSDVSADEPVDVKLRFWGHSLGLHEFELRWNDRMIANLSFTGQQAEILRASSLVGAIGGLNQLGVFHQNQTASRLDWYEIEYGRMLQARGGEVAFDWLGAAAVSAPNVSVAGGAIAEFHIAGFDDGRPRIFDIKSPRGLTEIVDFEYDSTSGGVAFQGFFGGLGVPPFYLVTDGAHWQRPTSIERKTPAQLKTPDNGAEYVIITHGDFRAAADKLAAWRAVDDRFGPPLTTHVVDVEDLYDEFSGGLLDPMAIRSFVNYAVDNWDPAPVFILLMGDGTYDYKNNLGISHTNWIPPYEDGSSMYDEWYVRIAGEDRLPDLAIGRLPVRSAANAEAVVDKLIAYDRTPEVGLWQTRVLLVADDVTNPSQVNQNESFFVFDAETIANFYMPQEFDIRKVYVGQFPLEGRTKPAARDEFIKRFNEGALILTYIGHGNPETLAHEQMFLLTRDITRMDNGRRLPLMYTAASQVGVFDDPQRQSMPEVLLNDPEGGVIGFISATRVGYHASNMILAREFHQIMYADEQDAVPLGLALTAAKQRINLSSFDRRNVQRYSLLGDPAQILNRPRLQVRIEAPDSLKAFQEVHLEGHVQDAAGNAMVDFNGVAIVQAFDSAVRSLVEGNPWQQPGAPIFRSLAAVKDGAFQALFRVPKDISYRESEGRITAYAIGDEVTALGAIRGIAFGGTQEGVEPDAEGPAMLLAFEGQADFRDGDFVPSRPLLKAPIDDTGGVNITGETGHEIELQIDDDLFKVTEFYTSLNGDYRTGVLEFEMPELEPGSHDISLKAWDNFNNSSRLQATIQVSQPGGSPLSSVIFHPNPMRDLGHFTYILTTPARVVHIKVFTLSGRLVGDMEGEGHPGYNQVAWEPPSTLANGTYLYRINVVAEGGLEFEATSAIQVAR